MPSPNTEQFIQDLLCHSARIERVLSEMGRKDWQFVDKAAENNSLVDVINQEVNFTGGRIDTLATFNSRTRLVLIEVKAGTAGPAAVEQLAAYLQNWTAIRDSLQLPEIQPENVVGIVLAEDFAGIGEVPPNIKLLKFGWNGCAWPFSNVTPKPEPLAVSETRGRTAKQSRLNSVAEHVSRISESQQELREAYLRIARCFLDDDDVRLQWVLQNPKGKHLAIHYKGIYIAHLWSNSNWFRLGYGRLTSTFDGRVAADNLKGLLEQFQNDFKLLLAGIDAEPSSIPADFRWSQCPK